jgi:hypothetical protein
MRMVFQLVLKYPMASWDSFFFMVWKASSAASVHSHFVSFLVSSHREAEIVA